MSPDELPSYLDEFLITPLELPGDTEPDIAGALPTRFPTGSVAGSKSALHKNRARFSKRLGKFL
jgi:hypothetical protein